MTDHEEQAAVDAPTTEVGEPDPVKTEIAAALRATRRASATSTGCDTSCRRRWLNSST